jgi:hypothetical protein
MFLLRCLFWLGLVLIHISQQEGARALALAGEAARAAGQAAVHAEASTLSAGMAQAVMNAAQQRCRAEPASCLMLASGAARALSEAAASRDTLSAADRTPAWRPAKTRD